MVAAFHMAGFNVWDVNMQDLCTGQLTLDRFRGVAFVGGFSYADVSGSAKGKNKTFGYSCILHYHSINRDNFPITFPYVKLMESLTRFEHNNRNDLYLHIYISPCIVTSN